MFKNTVYFNGSILTDASGRARVEFSLPDNVTDYRVIALGQTKDSRFATSEQTLSVRREYTLQTHIPAFAYPEDTFDVTLHAFNATRTITATELRLEIGTGASVETPIRKTILPVSGNHAESYRIRIDKNAPESIPYRAILMRSDEVLDQIDGVIRVNPLPLITTTERQLTSFTGETHVHLVPPAYTYASGSTVSVRVANSFFFAIPDIVHHLLEYPYGCAEQTLSALTPGIILSPESKKFLSAEAQKQLETKTSQGMQQLLRMQYMGGWKYWESDVAPNERVTPHIVRTLWRFFTQGYPIDPEILNEGMTYLANIVEFNNPEIMKDIDYQAEIFAALSSG